MDQGWQNLEESMFYLMFLAYLASTLLYWLCLIFKNELLGRYATIAVLTGFFANTAAIILRLLATHRPPLSNSYEFILTFCWGIAVVYLVAEHRYRLYALGSFVLPIPTLLLLFIILTMEPQERVAQAIPPALKSDWLTIHVGTAMLAYGAFAISFGLGLMYLFNVTANEREGKRRVSWLPSLDMLDELSYKIISFAFPMLTLCIIAGAVWANYAWGTYWSWDPKETWSLITWLIYAGYLHVRLLRGWRGERAAWVAVLGFTAVLFTFFGVNYLLPGLHSYA